MNDLPREVQAVIEAALKYDDERNGAAIAFDTRPDLADAVLAYRRSLLPPMPDRWARVYLTHTANPAWSKFEDAIEPTQGGHIAVVRYAAVLPSIHAVGGWQS